MISRNPRIRAFHFATVMPFNSALNLAIALAVIGKGKTEVTLSSCLRILFVFLAFVITADDQTATEIPESGYTFAVLKRAQALGDTQTLEAHGRRTVRIHIKEASTAPRAIERLFADALK